MSDRLTEIPEGADLVLELDFDISDEQESQIRRNFESRLPGRNILVLPKGVRLRPVVSFKWADDMARKLDALIKALADDQDQEGVDLEGRRLPAEREQGQSLG